MSTREIIFNLALAFRRLLLHVYQRRTAARFAKQALQAAESYCEADERIERGGSHV